MIGRIRYVIPRAWIDLYRLDDDQIDAHGWFVVPHTDAIKRASYIHSLVVIQKASRSEHDFLAPDNDIPTGMRIVQIAPELDETFMSIGDVLIDSWSRILAREFIEGQSHKQARVVSQTQVDIRHQPLKDITRQILWSGAPIIVVEVLKLRPALKPEG